MVKQIFPKGFNEVLKMKKSFAKQRLLLYAMLISRLVLFAIFQSLIALLLKSWQESEKYWMVVATLANGISILLLVLLFEREGKKYLSLFKFSKNEWKKDLSLFLILTMLVIPLAILPNYLLSKWFWGDPIYPVKMLFQPIPTFLTFAVLLVFPITIALAELATYFGYIMPRLEKEMHSKWIAVFLPVFFLSIQHCCLPLVLDSRFILYRALMYLPFALLIGVALHKRPRLLPYFVILHGIMDMQAVVMLILETNNV
jgi:membrane protease YdiL (CAAX protease family)